MQRAIASAAAATGTHVDWANGGGYDGGGYVEKVEIRRMVELPKAGGARVSRGPGVSSRFAVRQGEVFAVSGGQLFAFGP